jgi:hypothetical protein
MNPIYLNFKGLIILYKKNNFLKIFIKQKLLIIFLYIKQLKNKWPQFYLYNKYIINNK